MTSRAQAPQIIPPGEIPIIVRRGSTLRSDIIQQASVQTLCVALTLLQTLDGLLSFWGLSRFGAHYEGNVLLYTLMQHIGITPTLLVSKLFAIIVIWLLFLLARRIPWLPRALQGVAVVYIFGAVAPWLIFLTNW